jgi:pimeloyl-ACP methyl ester carboxylesterase
MPHLVFIHGPGAGACADAYHYQLKRFPNSVAPTLPGHLEGIRCPDVSRYTDWVRGWLWAQGLKTDLVLVGYTLGASIALQYGLDYPGEVKGLVVMTVAARPKTRSAGTYELRLRAAEDPKVYEEWLEYQRHARRRARLTLREAFRRGTLSADGDSGHGERADRRVPRHVVTYSAATYPRSASCLPISRTSTSCKA